MIKRVSVFVTNQEKGLRPSPIRTVITLCWVGGGDKNFTIIQNIEFLNNYTSSKLLFKFCKVSNAFSLLKLIRIFLGQS